MRTDELDFRLPPELIAQSPTSQRAASRLLHYRRDARDAQGPGAIAHRTFSDLPSLLRPGDLLVFNDGRVVPARFVLRKPTGGRVEGLFLGEPTPGRWRVMLKNLGRIAPNAALMVEPHPPSPLYSGERAGERGGSRPSVELPSPQPSPPRTGEREPRDLQARVVSTHGGGEYELDVATSEPALSILARIGRMPLPPYIRRERDADARDSSDAERYQTVYARTPGAVAAPTAGLHFTPELFSQLDARGVERAFVTLHVGLGTFKPVTVDDLSQHAMHREAYTIDASTADALNRAKRDGRRIVAVGTTSARVLESQPRDRAFQPVSGETDIFIYPPYTWRHVGALVTNFHLPRSTLIALVAAMVGLDEQRRIYQTAIEKRYRFFSYGDAMFID